MGQETNRRTYVEMNCVMSDRLNKIMLPLLLVTGTLLLHLSWLIIGSAQPSLSFVGELFPPAADKAIER